jgi:hypothetical protein
MRSLLFLLSCAILPCTLSAQTPPAATVPTVSLEFSLFAWEDEVAPLRFAPKREIEAIEPFTRSNAQTYSGPAALSFFALSAKPAADGQPPPPAATVTLPQGASRVTLITVPANNGGYQMHAVAEDGDTLPSNSVRVHNFTTTTLLVVVADKQNFEIKPAGTVVVPLQNTAAVIRVAAMENGRWRKMFNNVVQLNEDGRQNIILAPNGGRPVRMFTLPPWPRKLPAQ